MIILDDIKVSYYKNKINNKTYMILLDFLFFILVLIFAVLIDNLTKQKNSSTILISAVMIFGMYAIISSVYIINSVEYYVYSSLIDEINYEIDEQLILNLARHVKNNVNESSKFIERKLKFIDECLKLNENFLSIFNKCIQSIITSSFLSIAAILIKEWKNISSGQFLNYSMGVILVCIIATLIFHSLLLLSDFKFKYRYVKALRHIKLKTI